MFKTLIITVGIILAGFAVWSGFMRQPQVPASSQQAPSYKDATYVLDGKAVTLSDGYAEEAAAPGSASKVVTHYFGNEVRADFNGDGREDVALIVTQDTGGSGTFYYAVAALNTPDGWKGSEGYLLGDRIAPQATTLGENGQVIFNYAIRKEGESFATPASEGTSTYLILDPQTLQWGVVEHDFSGEADPARMTLGMKTWAWVKASRDGQALTPKTLGVFTLTFKGDGTFSAATDCNAVGGRYATKQSALAFSQMISTEMYCEGSQEQDFVKLLSDTEAYQFTSRGELLLSLTGGGTATFR